MRRRLGALANDYSNLLSSGAACRRKGIDDLWRGLREPCPCAELWAADNVNESMHACVRVRFDEVLSAWLRVMSYVKQSGEKDKSIEIKGENKNIFRGWEYGARVLRVKRAESKLHTFAPPSQS